MKKTFLLAILCCLFSIGFAGNVVPVNDARTASVNFIKSIYPDMNVSASDFVLKYTEVDENGDAVFYQFDIREQGFIIVSANDAVDPILAHSVNTKFNKDIHVYAFSVYKEEVKAAKNIVNPTALKAWDRLLSHRSTRGEVIGQYISEEVKPFVTSEWNQGEYFNYLCPAQEDASQYQQNINCDNHVPAGCVATAMSQVMFYYRYPEYGTGGVGYTPIHYEYDADNNPTDTFYYPMQAQRFNTLHEYDVMPSDVDFYAGEIAKLMWHAGISVRMDYGPTGSGAQSAEALTSLKNYWGYNRTAQMYSRNDYSDAKWKDTLLNELRALRPIYYSGTDAEGGHAFVLDGFRVINDVERTTHYGDTIENIVVTDSNYTYTAFEYIDSVQHLLYDSLAHIDTITSHYINDTTLVFDTTYYYTYFDTTYYYTYDSVATDSVVNYITSTFYTHTDSLTTYTYDTLYKTTEVHINWGWGGFNNAYFKIAGAGHIGGYTQNEAAMIGLYPADQAPKDTTGHKRVAGSRGSISDGAGNIDYRPNTDRTWTVVANNANMYTFRFLRLATEANNDVIIFYKNGDMTNEEKRVSGNELPDAFTINADSVTIRFQTDGDSVTDKGFVLDFTAITAAPHCSSDYVTLTGSGTISDKGDSEVSPETPYQPDGICKWEITGAHTTYFSYPKINLGLGDYVDIYEYKGIQRYELLKRIDIWNWPEEDVFTSHSRRIRIHFVTDNYDEKTGFELTYQIITGVKENGISDLNIFPNPTSSTLNVTLTAEEAGQLTFRISDMTGRTISTEKVENYGGEIQHTLNVSNLSKGLYLLSIEGNQGKTVHKFIVE